jgi:hypothetical protein
MKSDVESRYFVDAASKLLDVLETFNSRDEELSITDNNLNRKLLPLASGL